MSRETGVQRGGGERERESAWRCKSSQERWATKAKGMRIGKDELENHETRRVHPTAHGVPETLTAEPVVKKTCIIEPVGQSHE